MSGDPEDRFAAADSIVERDVVQAGPDAEDRLDRLVDLQSENSFPASDPPSFWAGE